MRADGHAMIGTVLMGVLMPAIFWNQAHVVNRTLALPLTLPSHTISLVVLGGAGLGSSMGLLAYYARLPNTGNS